MPKSKMISESLRLLNCLKLFRKQIISFLNFKNDNVSTVQTKYYKSLLLRKML